MKNGKCQTILKKGNESLFPTYFATPQRSLNNLNFQEPPYIGFHEVKQRTICQETLARVTSKILLSACRHAINFLSIVAFSFLRENLQVFWRYQIPLSVESHFEIFVLSK